MRTLMLPCTLILHILSLQLLPLDSSKANMVEAILHPVLFSTISTRPPRLSIWPVRSSSQPFTMRGSHQPHLP
ncbi:hypothetical protein E2I00_006926 [Balaenoptera physalus]|uniref:Secreted protein n=1 Tax=Balaenoptera physalus TaxID=9770 RepID=A0A6A1Q8G6_BALPH|nr:hypothetical protein E2I00_006926 [Balaenoptera physalus]